MSLYTRIRGLQIKDGDIKVLQLGTDAVETAKIKDKNVTLNKHADMALEAHILVADATLRPVSVAVSGDITILADGTTAIGATKVIDSMINDDVAAGLAGAGLTASAGQLSVDSITDNIVEADVIKEDETANCNGSNVTFTLANLPIANSVQVYLNGSLVQEGSGKDYQLSGTTITFSTAPADDDSLIIHYLKDD